MRNWIDFLRLGSSFASNLWKYYKAIDLPGLFRTGCDIWDDLAADLDIDDHAKVDEFKRRIKNIVANEHVPKLDRLLEIVHALVSAYKLVF